MLKDEGEQVTEQADQIVVAQLALAGAAATAIAPGIESVAQPAQCSHAGQQLTVLGIDCWKARLQCRRQFRCQQVRWRGDDLADDRG